MKQPAEFLAKTVSDYTRHLEQNFRADIVKENLVNTKKLINSIHASQSVAGDRASVSFSIPAYGIFQDMEQRNTAVAEQTLFSNTKPRKKITPHPWYNKNLWSTLGNFVRDLIFGYIDDSHHTIRKNFKTPNI